jgi:hypothetical protein
MPTHNPANALEEGTLTGDGQEPVQQQQQMPVSVDAGDAAAAAPADQAVKGKTATGLKAPAKVSC